MGADDNAGNEADRRFAVYGSLAPGGPNHHVIAGLTGEWTPGVVSGHLRSAGWGAQIGFPGIVLDDSAPDVAVQLFTSDDLPGQWDRLDAFEGDNYRRRVTVVRTEVGRLLASIYELDVE